MSGAGCHCSSAMNTNVASDLLRLFQQQQRRRCSATFAFIQLVNGFYAQMSVDQQLLGEEAAACSSECEGHRKSSQKPHTTTRVTSHRFNQPAQEK